VGTGTLTQRECRCKPCTGPFSPSVLGGCCRAITLPVLAKTLSPRVSLPTVERSLAAGCEPRLGAGPPRREVLLGRFPWIATLDIVRHVGVPIVKYLGPHNVKDGTSRPWAVLLGALRGQRPLGDVGVKENLPMVGTCQV